MLTQGYSVYTKTYNSKLILLDINGKPVYITYNLGLIINVILINLVNVRE
jgi:hypothetical protein